MSSVMQIAMKEMGQLIELANANLKYLPGPILNVGGFGAVADGETDCTDIVQRVIDETIASGQRTIFFPHGNTGQYYVTALTNADQVDFIGDNCSFVGGYSGTIQNLGGLAELKAESVKVINVARYGLQDAIDYAVSIKGTNVVPILHFPYDAGITSSSTVTIPAGIGLDMDSPIIITGTDNVPGLVVGEVGKANIVNLKVQVIRQNQSDWSDENCIGIQIINLTSASRCEIVQVGNFAIGVQFKGIQQGVSYNNVILGEMYNNKIAIDLASDSTGGSGWVNENIFIGGRFTSFSGVGTGIDRYGVRIRSVGGAYVSNNNNIFHKPSFELNVSVANPGEAIPIIIQHGNGNRFYDCRNENNSSTFMRCMNSSESNFAEVGYGTSAQLDDQSTYPSNFTIVGNTEFMAYGKQIFNSGPLHKKACYYDGETNINVPSVHLSTSSGGGNVLSNTNGLAINDKYLELDKSFGRAVGIFVDTSVQKRFVVRKDVDAGYSGRVYIRCYDASGNVLDNAGSGHPYAKGRAITPISYLTSFGKVYGTTADSSSDLYFSVSADVKYVAVLLANGTENLRIRGFSIFALDGYAACWTGYEEIVPGVNIGTAAPTAGTWEKGRRIVQANPTVGQPKGWISTATGTPGTWVSEGNL